MEESDLGDIRGLGWLNRVLPWNGTEAETYIMILMMER